MVLERVMYATSPMLKTKFCSLFQTLNLKKNQTSKLLAKKNILLKKIEKVKTIDENIIDLLHEKVMEMELDEYLARNDNFHELFVKIDMCLETLKNELRVISLNSVPSKSVSSTPHPLNEITKTQNFKI